MRHVSIMKHGTVREYTHVEVCDLFPVELTVYPPRDIRTRPRSSTDGKPIVRLSEGAIRGLCEREHPEQWQRYLATGEIPPMEDLLEPEDDDGDVDGDRRDSGV